MPIKEFSLQSPNQRIGLSNLIERIGISYISNDVKIHIKQISPDNGYTCFSCQSSSIESTTQTGNQSQQALHMLIHTHVMKLKPF